MLQHSRRVVTLSTGLSALLASGLAAADQMRWALVALGLAVAGLTTMLVFLGRAVGSLHPPVRQTRQRLDRFAAAERAASKSAQASIRDAARQVSAVHELTSGLPALVRQVRQLSDRLSTIDTAVQAVASETVNLSRLQAEVSPGTEPMPVLGGWAATNRTISYLVDTALNTEPAPHVVECGSGSSTVWIASALRKRGAGHVTALEHDPVYAERTLAELARRGLGDYATVIVAPLTELPDEAGRRWYDTSVLGAIEEIDVLFVDGPPGKTCAEARLPAFPRFADRLRPGATVVLDDTNRRDESSIVRQWTAAPVAGRSLEVIDVVGRSTVLRDRSV